MLKESGFNLIELMIVIAIMATMAAIAIPSYSRYLNKSRTLSAVVLTTPLRAELTEYGMLHNGNFNGVNKAVLGIENEDLTNGSKDVTAIDLQSQGTQVNIGVTLADNLGILNWQGQYENGNMQWECTYAKGSPVARYAPQGCQAE